MHLLYSILGWPDSVLVYTEGDILQMDCRSLTLPCQFTTLSELRVLDICRAGVALVRKNLGSHAASSCSVCCRTCVVFPVYQARRYSPSASMSAPPMVERQADFSMIVVNYPLAKCHHDVGALSPEG